MTDAEFDLLLNENDVPGITCRFCGDTATYRGEPCGCRDDAEGTPDDD